MQNEAIQSSLWLVEGLTTLIESAQFRGAVAVVLFGYLAFTVFARSRGAKKPKMEYNKDTGGGKMSLSMSGVHLTAMIAAIIAFITWPLIATNLTFGVILGGFVVAHYMIERRVGGYAG